MTGELMGLGVLAKCEGGEIMQECQGKRCSNIEIKTIKDAEDCRNTIIDNYSSWNGKCRYQRCESRNMSDAEIMRRLEILREKYMKLPNINSQKDEKREKTID